MIFGSIAITINLTITQKATDDPLGILYRDYIRHIAYLRPEMVIMENVYGLAQVKSADMVQEIISAFKNIGYSVMFRELMAADYGTPQRRRRLFFVAAKTTGFFKFPEPTHSEFNTLFDLPPYEGAGHALMKLPPAILKDSD
jgi:DNA (cytosine-5)-methyltransferase 1